MNVGRPIIELNLKEYEGKAILVHGDYMGDTIYRTKIIEQAGPILTILMKQMFNVTDEIEKMPGNKRKWGIFKGLG
jgi:hypothetical protein